MEPDGKDVADMEGSSRVCTRVAAAFIWGNEENLRKTSVTMVTIGAVTRLWDVCKLGEVTSTNDFRQDRPDVSNLFLRQRATFDTVGLVRVQHVTTPQ